MPRRSMHPADWGKVHMGRFESDLLLFSSLYFKASKVYPKINSTASSQLLRLSVLHGSIQGPVPENRISLRKSMHSITRIGLFSILFTACLAHCQTKPLSKPASSEPPIVNPPAQSAQPTSQESFELGRLTAQMEALQTQYSNLVQQIMREHPGFQWDPRTNQLVALSFLSNKPDLPMPKPAPKTEGK
jgi:hypothetical protein